MKLVRSVAYAVIVICALMCIVIAIYASRKPAEDSGETSVISYVVTTSDTTTEDTRMSVPNIAELILDKQQSGGATSAGVSINGNLTGEISYDEIVKRQNEDLDREFRTIISDYNKKYGIEVKTPTSTSANLTKDYKYFVNKNTKIIHRYDCLLKPVNSADMLTYDTIRDAEKAGYTERCPVCSP